MPVIKSAEKKLRQDRKRYYRNRVVRQTLNNALRIARTNPTTKTIQVAQTELDIASKKHIIHKNKAARLKSSLMQQITLNKKSISADRLSKNEPNTANSPTTS